MKYFSIAFMGNCDFSFNILKYLFNYNYNISVIVISSNNTKNYSTIKNFALNNNINTLEFCNILDLKFIKELKNYNFDIQIIVSFKFVPKIVFDIPSLGALNLHISLLPYYSGAAPINWSIIYGEYVTGITAFFLEESIDNGPIVFQKKDFIYYFDTLLTLRNRLIFNSKDLILKTINSIIIGKYFLKKQNFYNNYMKYSPKIFKKNCQINWNKKSNYIYNFVRGLSPHPCSWTKFNDKFFKIISLEVVKLFNLNPGQIYTDGYSYLFIGTKDYPVSIKFLQSSNKNPLDIKSFFNGNII